MARQLTDADAPQLPAAIRRMLKSQCDGEWARVTVEAGEYTVWNNPTLAARRVTPPAQSPAPAPEPTPEPTTAERHPTQIASPRRVKAPSPKATVVPRVKATPPAVAAPTRREKAPQARALQEAFETRHGAPAGGVHVESAPVVPRVDPAVWSADPENVDWSVIPDLDATASRLRDRLTSGLPASVPFQFLPDVLALYGMDLQIVEDALRHPQKVEVRPETRLKKYPILAFFRGDVVAILGMRCPTAPMVIAAYAVSKLDPDTHHTAYGSGTGGGGARRRDGLPRTVPAMLKAIRLAGAEADTDDQAATTVEVTYKGQRLGKVSVGGIVPRRTIESDYQRVIRKIHAIDRRVAS